MLHRLLTSLLIGAMLAGASATSAAAKPGGDGAGHRDATFAQEGTLRFPVPNGVRARQLERGPSGDWWMLMDGRRDTLLARSSDEGRQLPWDSGEVLRIRDVHPIAMSIAADNSARLLATTARREFVLVTATESGKVQEKTVLTASDNMRGNPTLTDAIWTPQGIVAVGFISSSPPQPVIANISDRILRWIPLALPGTWGSLMSVAQSADGVFVATGRGGYVPSGERGYPLVSFTYDLTVTPETAGGVLNDPREHCQFAMAEIVATSELNTVVGSTWGCTLFPETSQVVVAQQHPSLLSHEAFGAIPPNPGEGAVRIVPQSGLEWHGSSIAIDSQGRLIVAGTAVSTAAGAAWADSPAITTPRPLSARLLASGVADQSFALNSLALFNSRWSWTIQDVAVDTSDRPMLLGTATSGEQTEVRLVRLND